MAVLWGILAVLGGIVKWILLLLAGLLLLLLVLLAVLLLCPVRLDIAYENEEVSARAGLLCFSFRLWPRPEKPQTPAAPDPNAPPAKKTLMTRAGEFFKRQEQKLFARFKKKKASNAPKAPHAPKAKAKLTLDVICAVVRGAGGFLRAVLGALRITRIHIYAPVGGGDAADTALSYGKTNAWLYASLGFLNRFLYLSFDELRLEPDFEGARAGTERFSCRVSAQLIFVVIAGVRLILELYREKVLDALL